MVFQASRGAEALADAFEGDDGEELDPFNPVPQEVIALAATAVYSQSRCEVYLSLILNSNDRSTVRSRNGGVEYTKPSHSRLISTCTYTNV